MENIYYRSKISYTFIRDLSNILNLQYQKYKDEIVSIILAELKAKFKLLKN